MTIPWLVAGELATAERLNAPLKSIIELSGLSFSEEFPGFAPLRIFTASKYGAFPTNADNFVALTVMAEAIALNGGGGVAYFDLPGEYLTSDYVSFPSKTTIQSDGAFITSIKRKDATISDLTVSNTAHVIGTGPTPTSKYTIGSRGSGVSVRYITIDGNGLGQGNVTSNNPHGDCFRADYTDDVLTDHARFINAINSGIYLFGCIRSKHNVSISRFNGILNGAGSRNGFTITGPQDDATNQAAQDEHNFNNCDGCDNTDEGLTIGRNGKISVYGGVYARNGHAGIEGDNGTATSDTTSVPEGYIICGANIFGNGVYGINLGNGNVQRIIVAACLIENNPIGFSATFASGTILSIGNGTIIRGIGNTINDHGCIIGTFDYVNLDGLTIDGTGGLSTNLVFLATASNRVIESGSLLLINGGGGNLSITGKLSGRLKAQCRGTVSASTNGAVISGGVNGINDLELDLTIRDSINDGLLLRTNGAGNVTNVRLRGSTCKGNGGIGLHCEEVTGTITGLKIDQMCDFAGNTGLDTSGITDAMLASSKINTHTVRQVTSNPLDGTAGNRPTSPAVGAIVQYTDGALYICTNSSTPVWQKVGAQ